MIKRPIKRLHYPAYILLLSVLFFSCDPCQNLDCVTSEYHGQFRIVAATNGADLVFGPAKIYDKTQIRFYSLKNTDTIFFDYQTTKFPGMGYDSILYVNFFPKAELAYMRLGNGDIDTFKLSLSTRNTKCCGEISTITNFRFNNLVDIPGENGTQEIRK